MYMNILVDWVFDIIRKICAFLDSFVYWIVEVLFQLMFHLANFNVIGLYDLVNKVFYTNKGSGSFTKGSNYEAFL